MTRGKRDLSARLRMCAAAQKKTIGQRPMVQKIGNVSQKNDSRPVDGGSAAIEKRKEIKSDGRGEYRASSE